MTGGSLAPQVQQVRVLSVDEAKHTAIVRTTLGKEMAVSTAWQRAAYVPKEGERWLIDQSLGRWSFAALVGRRQAPPAAEITLDSLADVDMIGKQPASSIVWNGFWEKWVPGPREVTPQSYGILYVIQNPEGTLGWSSAGSSVDVNTAALDGYAALVFDTGADDVIRSAAGHLQIEPGVWAIDLTADLATASFAWGEPGTDLLIQATPTSAINNFNQVALHMAPPVIHATSSLTFVANGVGTIQPNISGFIIANGSLTGFANLTISLHLTKIREVF